MMRWAQRSIPWIAALALPLAGTMGASMGAAANEEHRIRAASGFVRATARSMCSGTSSVPDGPLLASAVRLDAGEPIEVTPLPDPCGLDELPTVPEAKVAQRFFGDQTRPVVALTFDDGPSRENTPGILETLQRLDAKATFFVLGRRAESMPELVADLAAHGHEVGNHGWSHTSLRSLWGSQIRDELCSTSEAIEAAVGRRPALFRPPFGRYPPSAVPLVGGLGMDFVLWSVDSHDWEVEDPAQLAARVVAAAKPGAIVLLHDRESVTRHALADIVEGLRARGFELVTVSEATGLSAYQPAGGLTAP